MPGSVAASRSAEAGERESTSPACLSSCPAHRLVACSRSPLRRVLPWTQQLLRHRSPANVGHASKCLLSSLPRPAALSPAWSSIRTQWRHRSRQQRQTTLTRLLQRYQVPSSWYLACWGHPGGPDPRHAGWALAGGSCGQGGSEPQWAGCGWAAPCSCAASAGPLLRPRLHVK